MINYFQNNVMKGTLEGKSQKHVIGNYESETNTPTYVPWLSNKSKE